MSFRSAFLLFTAITLVESCKTARVVTTTDTVSSDSLIVVSDTIPEKVFFVAQNGDTLDSLGIEVDIALTRVFRDTISFAAVGDIMMGTNFPNAGYLPPDDGYQLWSQVQASLVNADITFGNLEGVILTDGGEQKECKNPKACYLFRTPDKLAFHFQENGFDLLSIANNHANDFGPTGRKNTQNVLDSLNIKHAGSVERPYSILKKKGIKIGFIAFAPNKGTISIHDEQNALEMVRHLDSLSDIVVVSFHAGAEGSNNQHVTRKKEFYYGEDRGNVYEFSHKVIDEGADIVIGHGPHVVRGVEVYRDRFIAYSLGNFLTYGRFNLRGPNAYAPILNLNVNHEGKFLDGQIESFIQDYTRGPIKDSRNRATWTIKELSKNDFPENEISIDDSGRILYLHR